MSKPLSKIKRLSNRTLFSRTLFSRTLFSRTLFSRTLFSRTLFSRTLFSRMPVLSVSLFSFLRWPSPETTEWFCLRAAAWWVFLLLPGLHLFDANPSFVGLRHWGTEQTWQAVMGGALTVQIVAVCRGHLWMRVGALAGFGMIWAFIACLLWASAPHLWGIPRNTGVGLYSALAVDCYLVAIHLIYRWFVDHLSRQTPKTLQTRQTPSTQTPSTQTPSPSH